MSPAVQQPLQESAGSLTGTRALLDTVSVVVPCYNYGRFLPGCLGSILAQPDVSVEVLLIDDCSTDDSAAVATTLAARDPRVEFRRHSVNAGLIGTVNEGLEWARGEFVLVVSADDLLAPGALARAVSVMRKHPNVGLVYGRSLVAVEDQPPPEARGRSRATTVWPGERWLQRRCDTAHNSLASPTAVVRTAVHRAAGGYDPDCYHTCDLNMWLRIAAHADVAYIHGVPQAISRVHSGNMSHELQAALIDLDQRRKAFDSLFATCGPRLRTGERLRAAVNRRLARQALWQASRSVDRAGDPELIEALVGFALEVFPEARTLREWHGLQLRRRLGAGRSLRFPPFLLSGVAHRLVYHGRIARLRLLGT